MMGWGNHGYGMGWFGGIFMVLFWVLVIAGIIYSIRFLATGKSAMTDRAGPGPLQILQERYAKGEIDTAEFEERRKVLQDEMRSESEG
jgi:putative membrane protein